ncbi:unnamed protein product [Pleuronectes platessa]|uniref:Uncharacterized protein n=1 Tax=Pleuronectes platessa TaxID=8262 RepID=A0A9N7TK22_PLEPL|nr:unnamed protein product [Pleuronectes platessa]
MSVFLRQDETVFQTSVEYLMVFYFRGSSNLRDSCWRGFKSLSLQSGHRMAAVTSGGPCELAPVNWPLQQL